MTIWNERETERAIAAVKFDDPPRSIYIISLNPEDQSKAYALLHDDSYYWFDEIEPSLPQYKSFMMDFDFKPQKVNIILEKLKETHDFKG